MSKETFRDFYTKYHKRKNKYGMTVDSSRCEMIKKAIGTGKKVLDLGCRDGTLTKNYIASNELIGVDVDDAALAICKKDLGIQTFHLDLNEKIPFDDNSFDVVIAGEIIEHLIFPESFIKEVLRILRSGGMFCGSTPNVTRIKHRVDFLFGKAPFFDDTAHLRFFSPDSLDELISEYFNEVKIIPFGGHILGNKKFGVLNCGISVTESTPLYIGKLFSSNLFWKAVKR